MMGVCAGCCEVAMALNALSIASCFHFRMRSLVNRFSSESINFPQPWHSQIPFAALLRSSAVCPWS